MKSKQVLVILFVAFSIECNLSCDLNTSSEYDGCDFNSLFLVNPKTGYTVAQENCGLEVDKSTFQEQPYVFYPDANEDLKYTLIMVDDDDPLNSSAADDEVFLQWMIVNIDGTAMKYGVGANYGETFAGNYFKLKAIGVIFSYKHFSISSNKSIARNLHSLLHSLHLRANFSSS